MLEQGRQGVEEGGACTRGTYTVNPATMLAHRACSNCCCSSSISGASGVPRVSSSDRSASRCSAAAAGRVACLPCTNLITSSSRAYSTFHRVPCGMGMTGHRHRLAGIASPAHLARCTPPRADAALISARDASGDSNEVSTADAPADGRAPVHGEVRACSHANSHASCLCGVVPTLHACSHG